MKRVIAIGFRSNSDVGIQPSDDFRTTIVSLAKAGRAIAASATH